MKKIRTLFRQLSLHLDLSPSELRSDHGVPEPTVTHSVPEERLSKPLSESNESNKIRYLDIQGQKLEYTLHRTSRRSIGFLITPNGLRISAPKRIAVRDIERAISEKQCWIFKKLGEQQERALRAPQLPHTLEHGAYLPYLGESITLHIHADTAQEIEFDPITHTLTLSLAHKLPIKEQIHIWYRTEALRIFAERLSWYANQLGVTYHSFTLSSATTQWGCCTAHRKIRLNWKLIHLPLTLIDYVIAHELSHLNEMNHGPKFWATVQSIFPDFKAARKILKQHSPNMLHSNMH